MTNNMGLLKPPGQAERMRARGYASASAVARMVGVTPAAISGWVERGNVAVIRVGGRVYIDLRSVLAYLGPQAAAALGITGK
jgi:hypothetical protein